MAALVSLTAKLSLVFNVGIRAGAHADLARDFQRIEVDIAKAGEHDFTEKVVDIWDARILELAFMEPPTLCPLVRKYQNELNVVLGHEQKLIPWWRVPHLQVF